MAWDATQPTSATNVDDSVTQMVSNLQAITVFCSAEHTAKPGVASVYHCAGECSVIAVGTVTVLAALTPVACAFGWDTTNRRLYAWTAATSSNKGGFVPSGTKMVFYADTAPAGWTINDTLDDKLVFITKGSAAGGETGGGVHSTGVWTISGFDSNVGSHTLTIPEMPSHDHTIYEVSSLIGYTGASFLGASTINNNATTSSVGGGGGHVHPMAAFDGNWRPDAYCYIICTKD
jgi:hypothetical protein